MSEPAEPTAPSARGGVVRRMGWGAADQALSTLTNFALGVVVARNVSAQDFGAFSLAYSMFVLTLGFSRATISEPFMVRFSQAGGSSWREATRSATGAGAVLGIAAGVAVAVAAVFVDDPTPSLLLALGVCLPGLLLQDVWRYCFIAARRERQAFVIDAVFVAVLAAAMLGSAVWGDPSAANLVLMWGVGAAAGAVVAIALTRIGPGVDRTAAWFRSQRDLSPRFAGEFVAVNGATQVTLFVVAAVAGLAAVGAIRAGLILFGPVLLLYQGSRLLLIPEGTRRLESMSSFRPFIVRLSFGLPIAALGWGALLAFLPPDLGRALLGDSWDGASELILPLTIVMATSGAELAALIGLRAMAAARHSFRARMAESALTAFGGIGGALVAGSLGAVWGLASAYVLEVAIWWREFRSAVQTYEATGRRS